MSSEINNNWSKLSPVISILIGRPIGGPSLFLSTLISTPGIPTKEAESSFITSPVMTPSLYLNSTKLIVILALLGVIPLDPPISLGSEVPAPTLVNTEETAC